MSVWGNQKKLLDGGRGIDERDGGGRKGCGGG